jgi:creatinine amidohydrolase/Fe(II)-dependent formamide hydrolase-like protein
MLRTLLILSGLSLLSSPALRAQAANPRSISELTASEVRAAVASGVTRAVVPIGGTEQNGLHIILGKHNYSVTEAARIMAERVDALVAPTVEYVPEGDYNSPNFARLPGVISHPSPAYDGLLESVARSLASLGFTEILFIGDSGSDQTGMTNVADKLNAEWAGSGKTVYALTDYYRKGGEHLRAWLLAQYGYDEATVGNHAGIVGTSQVMHVFPEGIRREKMVANSEGTTGDPTLSTPEIGRMIIEFKVNAGIGQYRTLSAARSTQPGG